MKAIENGGGGSKLGGEASPALDVLASHIV